MAANVYFSLNRPRFESSANSSPFASLRQTRTGQVEFNALEIDKGIPLRNDRGLDFILTPASISYLGNTSLTIMRRFTYNEKSFFRPFTTTAPHPHTRMHSIGAVKEIIGCPSAGITDVVQERFRFTVSGITVWRRMLFFFLRVYMFVCVTDLRIIIFNA